MGTPSLQIVTKLTKPITNIFAFSVLVSDAIALEDIMSDVPNTVPGALDTSTELEGNLPHDQITEVLGDYPTDHAMPELDVGVRNDDPILEME